MKLTSILFLGSTIISSFLLLLGSYLILSNIFNPSGNLFKGFVLFSFGLMLLIQLFIISVIGNIIKIFTEIYTQQINFQNKFNAINNKKNPFSDIFKNLNYDNNVVITNLDTGETTSQPLDLNNSSLLSFIQNFIENNKKTNDFNNISNLNIEQLEKELSQAVKSENFERAQEIRDIIKNMKKD